VAWAHPEFGQIIASCGFDRYVRIWEEVEGVENNKWQQRAPIPDFTDTIQDIKFAPRKMGLILAAASDDGFVRIFEATDVTNLSLWSLKESFEVQKKISSISWNMNPYESKPRMVVGTKEDSAIQIWEYNESQRRWTLSKRLEGHTGPIHDVSWAPQMGKSKHYIASGSEDKTVRIWSLDINDENNTIEAEEIATFNDHNSEVWKVQWNVSGTILASSGDDGTVKLWKANFKNEWSQLLDIESNE